MNTIQAPVIDQSAGSPAADRFEFLARASEALSSSLEHEATLQNAARIAVPFLADWCSIDVVSPSGELTRVASAHIDPDRESLAVELHERYPYNANTPYGPPNVVRTGESELYEDLTEEMIREQIQDPERVNGLLRLGIRSAIIAPLKARARILGAISFISDVSGRRFGRDDLSVAEDLAARVALAVDNARLYREAQEAVRVRDEALEQRLHTEDRLISLLRASNTLLNTLDMSAVLPQVMEIAGKLIEADGYAVWRLRKEEDSWRIIASSGLSEAFVESSDRLPTTVAMPDKPIIAEDVKTAPILKERRRNYEEEGIASLLAVPLKIHGEVTGSIVFYCRRLRCFAEPEVLIATALANITAASIGAAELYEAETAAREKAEAAESAQRRAAAEAALLHRAGRQLGSTLDTSQVYSTLRELVAEIMDCDGLFVSTFDSQSKMIRCAYGWVEGRPIDPSGLPEVPLAPEGKGVQSQVIRSGEPLIIHDMEDRLKLSHTSFHVNPDGSYAAEPSESRPQSQSAIYVPIKLEGQVLGTVQVQSLRKDAFSDDHLRMLEALMLQVAGAFRNAFLYQQIRSELEERIRAETELERRQADIEALNERLQRAMTETHHRVKNNLQIIAAMVDLQLIDRPESVPASHVKRLGSYVLTLAAVHDILTQESKEDSQAQFASAEAVLHKLVPLMQQATEGRRIIPTVEDIMITAKQGTAIALVVNELVNNAFKHGARNVSIDLRQAGEELRLSVCDDGPGFPPDFDPATTGSTGLELVESLSRWDLQGSVRYENMVPEGACVIVTAPLLTESPALYP